MIQGMVKVKEAPTKPSPTTEGEDEWDAAPDWGGLSEAKASSIHVPNWIYKQEDYETIYNILNHNGVLKILILAIIGIHLV